MKDGGPAFPCSKCGEPGLRIQGHQWLCPKHYRFGQMRAKARQDGKMVPAHEQLTALVLPGLLCADCGIAMNWLARDGQTRVVTLQHYRDGSYGLVCRSCNTRHAFMVGDSYRAMNKDCKQCPQCREVKPLTDFSVDNGRTGPMKVKSWCLSCTSIAHTNWQRNNRDDYNAKQRAYRAKRKAEGNPVASGS